MYEVRFYRGDYRQRQLAANADNCVAYVEHHFNSAASPGAGYAVVVCGSNASQTSRNWGRWYAEAIGREFDVKVGGDQGILVGGFNGRGDDNLRYTDMPAVLLEPLFASNPAQADWIRSESGQTRLARVLVDSLRRFFQKGGRIAFSVGHKYKTAAPADRGAAVAGGGSEADYAEAVLLKAKAMLEAVAEPQTERRVRVMIGDDEVWSGAIDADAEVSWDGLRGVLRIDQPVSAPTPGTPRASPVPRAAGKGGSARGAAGSASASVAAPRRKKGQK
jgi:hypothetical protein